MSDSNFNPIEYMKNRNIPLPFEEEKAPSKEESTELQEMETKDLVAPTKTVEEIPMGEVEEFNPYEYSRKKGIPIADSDMGAIEQTARMFGKGVTYNLLDELIAGAKTGGRFAFGDLKLKDVPESYRLEQQKQQALEKQIKEESPWLSAVPEFAGGLVSPVNKLLFPLKAAKAIVPAAKIATEAVPAAETIAASAIPAIEKVATEGIKKLPTYGEAISKAAKPGIVGGAVAGFGESEAGIESPMEMAKDVGLYSATGGVFGGLLGAGGRGLSGLGERLKSASESEVGSVTKNMASALLTGYEGKDVISGEAENRMVSQIRDFAEKFSLGLMSVADDTSKLFKDLMSNADLYFNYLRKNRAAQESVDAFNKRIQILNFIDDAKYDVPSINPFFKMIEELENANFIRKKDVKILSDDTEQQFVNKALEKLTNRQADVVTGSIGSDEEKFLALLSRYFDKKNKMTPSEEYNFARYISGEDVPGLGKITDKKFLEIVRNYKLSQTIKDHTLEKIEQLFKATNPKNEGLAKEVRDSFKYARSVMESFLSDGKSDRGFSDKITKDYSKQELKEMIADKYEKMLREVGDTSAQGVDTRQTLRNLKNKIGAEKNLTDDPDLDYYKIYKILDDSEKVASEWEVYKSVWNKHGAGHAPAGDLLSRLTSLASYGGTHAVGRIAAIPKNVNNWLVNASNEQLIPLIEKLPEGPAQALKSGIENASMKNAALFMIMQNPKARGIVSNYLGMQGAEGMDNL